MRHPERCCNSVMTEPPRPITMPTCEGKERVHHGELPILYKQCVRWRSALRTASLGMGR